MLSFIRVSMLPHKYVFLSVCLILLPTFLSGSNYTELCKKPKYQELENKFGHSSLVAKLVAFQNNLDSQNYERTVWNPIADKVIGTDCVEGKRRHFLVSVMLYAEKHLQGLQTLEACYNALPNSSKSSIDTPHGPIYMQIHADQYEKGMEISKHIRKTMFGDKHGQAKPFILVDKVDYRMNTAIKWALFKAAAVAVHMISSVFKKEEKKQPQKQKDKTLSSSFVLADIFQTIEEIANQELEKKYPILKTHEVKSLIGEKTWWLYDRKNWITMAGLGAMSFLVYAIIYDKLPYIYQEPKIIILEGVHLNNITVSNGSTFIRL